MQSALMGGIGKDVWLALKTWRKIKLGPLALQFKFEKSVFVSRNGRRWGKPGRRLDDGKVAAPPPAMVPSHSTRRQRGLALIVGVGPGLGYALADLLARAGFEVILVARNADRLAPLVAAIRTQGGRATAYGCDATMETSVEDLFDLIRTQHGALELVIYSLQSFGPGNALDIELAAFEDGLKHNCVGAFLVARAAGRAMVPQRAGSIMLVGSTSAMIGREAHLNLAVGKFAQRAMAQVLARELWPKGIHVAHVVIDADIREQGAAPDGEAHAEPQDIAASVLHLHDQPRSAWTSELDIRPWNEKFWEHC